MAVCALEVGLKIVKLKILPKVKVWIFLIGWVFGGSFLLLLGEFRTVENCS